MDPSRAGNVVSPSLIRESTDIHGSSNVTFGPHDVHKAKVLDLLRVDLDAIDNKAKLKRGLAKVDRQWMSKLDNVAWRHAFTEEGHLRITRIMSLLPKLVTRPDAHSSLWKSYRRLQCAALGLADYNKRNESAQYYLVKPITANPSLYQHDYVSHANFLAKRKDDPGSPVELFFAEVFYSCDEVTTCCRLEPRLLPPEITPPLEDAIFKRRNVIHPEGFECSPCKAKRLRYL
ncbi:hypothetical protein vseg_016215 [Gypsophila vaccaria]